MAEKAALPVKNTSNSGDKKAKPRKASASGARGEGQTALAPVAGTSNNVAKSGPLAVEEDKDVVSILDEPLDGGGDATDLGLKSAMLQQNPLAFVQQPFLQPPVQMPYFFPPQALGQYAGFSQPFQFNSKERDDWDSESVASSTATSGSRRQVHQVSDDEEDRPQAQAKPAALDFSSLKEGKLASLLKEQHEKVAEADKVGPEINNTLAQIINAYFGEKFSAGLEKATKDYPRVANIQNLRVPKLEPELFSALDQSARLNDVSLQNLQKGVVSAISALAPVALLVLQRGQSDEELDNLSGNVIDAIKMMALVSTGITVKRRELIKPSMQQTYAKEMAKGVDGSPEWLYGGNLSQVARKCEEAKKVAEKLVKRKTPQHSHPNSNPQNRGAGRGQGKKFKFQQNGKQQQFGQRMFSYQGFPQAFPTPQPVYQQQYQYQQYPQAQYQDFRPRHKQNGQQGYNQQNQDFQKRGPKK